MGRGSKEFKAYALPLIGSVAEKDDAAFLLFLGEWIGENDHRIHVERLIEIEQSTVRIDYNGLAGFAETPAVCILSRSNHADPHEHSSTAPSFVDIYGFNHNRPMLRHFYFGVNRLYFQCSYSVTCPVAQPLGAWHSVFLLRYAQTDGERAMIPEI